VGGEKGIFLAARRLRSPALRDAGLLTGFPAPFGHEQGESFIGGILERSTFQQRLVPTGIDPELHDDPASFTLLHAQSALTLTGLGSGIELRGFRSAGTAFHGGTSGGCFSARH
jgi:hypothetical protein